jgi:transcriptional regulator with XRE-family HTH domain
MTLRWMASNLTPSSQRGIFVPPLASSARVPAAQLHSAAIWLWDRFAALRSAMSDFQSIGRVSRISEASSRPLAASSLGFPTGGSSTLIGMREKPRTAFGERLLKARKLAGLSQPQLAKLVGVSPGTIGEAETSAIGSKHTAKLAGVLGVRAEWLSTGDGAMVDGETWPFHTVTLARVLALAPQDRALVESMLKAAIESREYSVTSTKDDGTFPLLRDPVVSHKTGSTAPQTSTLLENARVGGKRAGSKKSGGVPVPRSGRGPKRAA